MPGNRQRPLSVYKNESMVNQQLIQALARN